MLRRLAVFRGDFTLASALAVARDAGTSEGDFVEGLAELSAKSLLNVDTSRQPAHYRLLFLTRDYAFGKLSESGELQAIAAAHAAHFLDLQFSSDTQMRTANALTWIDDLRLAFEWAFSPEGDAVLGMKLICETIDLGRLLSVLNEFTDLLDQALLRFDQSPDIDPKLGVRLRVERLSIHLHGQEPLSQSQPMIDRAEAMAQQAFDTHADPSEMFEVYLSKFARAFGGGDAPGMMAIARDMRTLATRCGLESDMRIVLDRIGAQAAHFAGDHADAARMANHILACSDADVASRPQIPGDRINPKITMQIIQARTLWLTGFPVQAAAMARQAVEEADGYWEHVACYALAMATIPIALWRGDVVTARDDLARLSEKATECSLEYWQGWSDAYAAVLGVLANRSSGVEAGAWPDILFDHLATVQDVNIADIAVQRAEQGLYGWCAPEVIRVWTCVSIGAGSISPADAEHHLLRSLALAREQGATAWQLRTAVTLGNLWQQENKAEKALALIDEALSLISEGLEDADIVRAITLRKALTDE